MKHVVILAHPSGHSFNAAAAKAYLRAAQSMGHSAVLRDLYAMGFDPRLGAQELPWAPDFAPGADAIAERALIAEADVIVFVYPLWFNAPPAMLKGYVERVFGMGFGYEDAQPGVRPLLAGKRLVSLSSSGAPAAWVDQTGALSRLRVGFDEHLAAVCGLTVLEHLNFGAVTPGIRPDAVEAMLGEVDALARRLFSPAASVAALT
ncbi:MAG: NAD(P)H-dependent oxidoreductase [Caulobacterales bacterium]